MTGFVVKCLAAQKVFCTCAVTSVTIKLCI